MFSLLLSFLLTISLPEEKWTVSYQGNLDTVALTQYVPKGESQEKWSRQINFMEAKGVSLPPRQMFQLMIEELKSEVPHQEIQSKIVEESATAVIGEFWLSPDSTIHEHSFVKIIQAETGMVTILYTVKSAEEAQKEREAILSFLKQYPQ